MSQNGVLCLYYISVISFKQVMKKTEWYCLWFERLGKITQFFNEYLNLIRVDCWSFTGYYNEKVKFLMSTQS